VDGGTALVAAMFNHGGLYVERPGGVVPVPAGDAGAIGAAVRQALKGTVFEPDFNYRDRKKTDWPAYQASGCKSVAAFERAYARFEVAGETEQNAHYRIESPAIGRFCLHLVASVPADLRLPEFAAAIDTVCTAWRASQRPMSPD
jgi:hypothetical protein